MPDPKILQLSPRSDRIVLGKQRGLEGIYVRGLYIGLLESIKHVCPGHKWKHGHYLIKSMQKGGGDKVKVIIISSIRPTATEQIRKYSKQQFITYFNILLPIFTTCYYHFNILLPIIIITCNNSYYIYTCNNR